MANSCFKFKQFTVNQDKCAMKVCTDACLFGAMVNDSGLAAASCLDIGTGTGLLALMLAQKNKGALIHAVEINTRAATQAQENIKSSPWAGNIRIFNNDILAFNTEIQYDCIISNPPFFEGDLQSPDDAKNNAKHNSSLNLLQLLQVVKQHLASAGFFAVLLPARRLDYFIEQATQTGLYLTRKILIKQSPTHNYFRGILFFERTEQPAIYSEITIKENGHNYTQEFAELLKDYYLFL
jgi:tRNA1Val (adenine37-N6)-methyltransferase